jgi:biopolymer transport protein ExbB/TolQ
MDWDKIALAFADGGVWMYAILVSSIIVLGIIVERFVFLFFRFNLNGKAFMAQIQKLVLSNNIDRAIKLCNTAPTAALARVIKAGLTRANKSEEEIKNALEEMTLEVLPQVEKRTGSLQSLANIAMLLGLLGTVVGLIGAFDSLATVSADKRQEALGKYVALAMHCTAFGLIVSIPAMLAHVFLMSVTKKIIDEIDHNSLRLENLLVARLRSGQTGGGSEEA